MAPEVEKLTAADYDELLFALNTSFNHSGDNTFDKILPAMWRRTDEAMARHLVVRDGKRIAAVVGVYPLPVRFGNHELLFSTVGNVGTLPEYRGRGYMKLLMNAAMEELKRIGADAARLGGARQRYNRYGFELSGQLISFSLSRKNLAAYFDGSFGHGETYTPRLQFKAIGPNDTESLAFAERLHNSSTLHCHRGDLARFRDVATAWRMIPVLATEPDGTPVGFLCADADGTRIAEHSALTPELDCQMLFDWLAHIEKPGISFTAFPWDTEFANRCSRIAEWWNQFPPTQFKIINWLGVAKAALEVRARIAPIPSGRLAIRITGYGTLVFENDTVSLADENPDIELDRLAATRYIFGSLPSTASAVVPREAAAYAAAIFPLPISWNNQDRV